MHTQSQNANFPEYSEILGKFYATKAEEAVVRHCWTNLQGQGQDVLAHRRPSFWKHRNSLCS